MKTIDKLKAIIFESLSLVAHRSSMNSHNIEQKWPTRSLGDSGLGNTWGTHHTQFEW